MQLKKILLPVDGSEHSLHAANDAADLAKMAGAEVLLLAVYGQVSSLIMGEGRQEVTAELKGAAAKVEEKYTHIFTDRQVPVEAKVLKGEPGATIVATAKSEGCDLIVMGSRGLSDTEGLLVGSVTHKVLQLSDKPVFVVR